MSSSRPSRAASSLAQSAASQVERARSWVNGGYQITQPSESTHQEKNQYQSSETHSYASSAYNGGDTATSTTSLTPEEEALVRQSREYEPSTLAEASQYDRDAQMMQTPSGTGWNTPQPSGGGGGDAD
ncbi:hypothetical protein I316_01937 [Kwoniella heveanensis BCC8398]|uniref:Uncharacterized protein n=1 Tax=Kwoniella heveanensis BCC8398 TaxID=1296120 RepID=A0A1B9GYM1_9TREE|nr:hypothetical protein I316_01937 [Kwoniella heveanensis BCC8398]